jgi:hypothetical protein
MFQGTAHTPSTHLYTNINNTPAHLRCCLDVRNQHACFQTRLTQKHIHSCIHTYMHACIHTYMHTYTALVHTIFPSTRLKSMNMLTSSAMYMHTYTYTHIHDTNQAHTAPPSPRGKATHSSPKAACAVSTSSGAACRAPAATATTTL